MFAALNSALFWFSELRGDTEEYGPVEPPLRAAPLFPLPLLLPPALASVDPSPSVGKKFAFASVAVAGAAGEIALVVVVGGVVGGVAEDPGPSAALDAAEGCDLGLEGVAELLES